MSDNAKFVDKVNKIFVQKMMEQQPLYPTIVREEVVTDLINKNINTNRLTHMNREIELIRTHLEKYKKIKNNYTKYDNLIRNVFTALSTISAIATIIISTMTPFGIISLVVGSVLTAAFGSIPIIQSIISKLITSNFTSKRKKFFEDRIVLVNEYLNKLYYYIEKSKEDGIITIDEIDKFNSLIEEFQGKLNNMKLQQNLSNQIESQIPANDNNVLIQKFSKLNESEKSTILQEFLKSKKSLENIYSNASAPI